MSTAPLGLGGQIPEWTLGDRLRKARDIAGLQPLEMAARLKVSKRTIHNYENGGGKRGVPWWVVEKYAQISGVALWWLDGKKGPDDPSAIEESECACTVIPIRPHAVTGAKSLVLAA